MEHPSEISDKIGDELAAIKLGDKKSNSVNESANSFK